MTKILEACLRVADMEWEFKQDIEKHYVYHLVVTTSMSRAQYLALQDLLGEILPNPFRVELTATNVRIIEPGPFTSLPVP